jgi:hypothetical protein
VLHGGAPQLVLGTHLLGWSAAGYGSRSPRPPGRTVSVITPSSVVALLRAGWEGAAVPLLHPTAHGGRARTAVAKGSS